MLHEPPPYLDREAHHYYCGRRGYWLMRLRQKHIQRMESAENGIADRLYSYCIPAVRDIDKEARFVVLIREPISCCSSFWRRHAYALDADLVDTPGRRRIGYFNRYRIRPRGNRWPSGWNQSQKLLWMWLKTYKTIFRLTDDSKRSVFLTHRLSLPRMNRSKGQFPSQLMPMDEGNWQFYHENVEPFWDRIKSKYG